MRWTFRIPHASLAPRRGVALGLREQIPVPPALGPVGLARTAFGLIALAIAFEPATAQAPIVRDSAGVRIVENRAPAWGPGEGWRVEVEPALSIGEEASEELGEDPYLLHVVRRGSVLSDGTVVVALAWWGQGSQFFELRYYDHEGRYLTAAGGFGEGPGEFRQPYGIHRMAGDSLLAHDRSRFAVFGPRGELGRTGRFGPARFADWTGLVSDSTLVGVMSAPGATQTRPSGVRRGFRSVILADLQAGGLDTLGVLVPSGSGYHTGEPGMLQLPIPFTPESPMARPAGGHGLAWIGDPEVGELRAFGADGTLEVVAHLASRDRTVDPDLARLWRAGPYDSWVNVNQRAGVDVRRLRAYPQGSHVPATLPAYYRIMTDVVGNVWVQLYPISSEGVGTPSRDLWDVYDPTGIWQGTVEFPTAVTGCEPVEVSLIMEACSAILEIGDDYVLIVHSDEQGVERVRIHRLVKP